MQSACNPIFPLPLLHGAAHLCIVSYMSTTEITYSTGTYYGEADILHTWKISDDQGVASELYVTMDTLTVANIETREDRRGEGLARALWEAATAQMAVVHDLPGHRTPEGDAFAEAVGGDSATECHIAGCYACDTDY